MPIPRSARLVFWLLLGSLSVILAEVVSFSAAFPFFDPWGLFVVYPLYTLHVLVLAALIFRRHRVTFYSLFLTGALLGMYEAYLTKVLWDPFWAPDIQVVFAGVYVVHTAILVLFWHPLMAFMLPVMTAEWFFAPSSETFAALPDGLRKRLSQPRSALWIVGAFAVYCGVYESVNSPSPQVSLLSVAGAGLVFTLIAFWWNRLSHRYNDRFTLRHLLPSKRQTVVLVVLLLLVYVLQTFVLRPEALPRTLLPHLTIWVIYAVLIILLVRNIKNASLVEDTAVPSPLYRRWRLLVAFWLTFAVSAFLFGFIKNIAALIAQASWFVGVGWGLLLLLRSAKSAFQSNARSEISN